MELLGPKPSGFYRRNPTDPWETENGNGTGFGRCLRYWLPVPMEQRVELSRTVDVPPVLSGSDSRPYRRWVAV